MFYQAPLSTIKKEYRMSNREAGSSKFGVCEVCGKNVETTYLQTEEIVTNYGKIEGQQWFGHKECLEAQREN